MAILLDFLRDPVRKLDANQSVLITVSVLLLWGVISLSAWGNSQREIREFLRNNARMLTAFRLLVLAIVPGSIMAVALYIEGYKVAALGLISYLAPSAGVVLGAIYAQRPEQTTNLLRFYCIVNGIALTGVIAEHTNISLPALGGLKDMKWIRYSGSEIVQLIGGFYRSPDIMGLHAAQVVMFSLILMTDRRRSFSVGWLIWAGFAAVCLLLSGRRKMLGMPLVFVASLGLLCHLRAMRHFSRALVPFMALLIALGGMYLVTTDNFVGDEYTNFATTLFTDGAARSKEIIVGSAIGTLAQSGLLGSGIGSATQGAYHVRSGPKLGWQEDGVSRLLKELGVFGVLFVTLAAFNIFRGVSDSVRKLPREAPTSLLQLMFVAVVLANLASFIISHQQYSGDPPSALIVLFVLGMALSLTRIDAQTTSRTVDRTLISR